MVSAADVIAAPARASHQYEEPLVFTPSRFSLDRKMVLNLVAQDQGTQTSLRGRRKKAAWDDSYMLQIMLQIIACQAHA